MKGDIMLTLILVAFGFITFVALFGALAGYIRSTPEARLSGIRFGALAGIVWSIIMVFGIGCTIGIFYLFTH
jgi:hypothetical protein